LQRCKCLFRKFRFSRNPLKVLLKNKDEKGGNAMENEVKIIAPGTNDVKEMAAMSCCWPPGTQNMQMPEPTERN
jgi:hypothetical protein